MPNVTAEQLSRFLHYPPDQAVTADDAALSVEVASGWLSGATGINWETVSLPESAQGPVFSWTLELAAINYENPTSMTDDASLDNSSRWANRRAEILKQAAVWATRNNLAPAVSQVAVSQGNFPPARELRW